MTSKKTCNLPFTLAFRLPRKAVSILKSYQSKLQKICDSIEDPFTAHITVKFLGHSSDYLTKERVIGFIPEIYRIAKRFVPIGVYVKGIETFNYHEGKSPVVYLKILPNQKLLEFHKALCDELGDRIDIFPHADGENYLPHITLSKFLKPQYAKKLNTIIHRSKKAKKRLIKIEDLVIFTPSRMFHVSESPDFSMICPPL